MRINKITTLLTLCFLLIILTWQTVSAQCSNCTSDGPLNTLSYARPAYNPEWTTVQSNSVEGRDYMLFNVVKGEIYRWTTYGAEDDSIGLDNPCADDGDCVTGLSCEGLVGSKTCELAYDTQLTLLRGTCSDTGEVLSYNRNGLFRNQSVIEWKADFNGTVFLLVNNYDCTTSCDLDGLNCMTTSVKWQRIDSSHCSDCSYSYPTTTDPPGTPAPSFVNPVDAPSWTLTANNDIKAGEFQTFSVDKGKIYRWSTCSDDSFDTQLTLYRGLATAGTCGQFLEYSDDSPEVGNCLSGTKQTVLEWKADFYGYVTVLLNQYSCVACGKSQNPTDPYGHCAVSSLEWQRYDCNECQSNKGTISIDTSINAQNGVNNGDYFKFNLEKGGQYLFRSVAADSGSKFTGLLTLRKEVGSACYGEVLKQSTQVQGSHIQQIAFNAMEDMTVELLVSGHDCSNPAGKTADITYQMTYDPGDRFDEYEDSNGDTWTGSVFDAETQTVFYDDNVTKESWADAILYCENFTYTIPGSGGTVVDGWSLPNINQLYSVVDFNLFDPATSADWVSYITDTSGEGGACTQPTQETDCTYPKYICNEDNVCARNNWYWSSTTVYGTEEFAWGVNMMDGRSYRALKYDYDGTNSTSYRTICVTGVSVFGELDAKRPAEERIFSGWACDKSKVDQEIEIYFELFYSEDPVNNPGNIKSVLKLSNFVAYGGTTLKTFRYGWEYGDTDVFPAPGSITEFKINSNCSNTAQTTEHAYELDFNDTSNDIVKKMRNAINSDSAHQPPYYVTAWAKEWGSAFKPKSELVPKREIFVISDLCGDNHVTGSEMCDDGNVITEECAYNTSCIVCDSSCNLSAGYSPHCGDTTIDSPDENCDCGPGYWVITAGTCKSPELGSKRCPGYGTGTESCTICNEICQEEILTVPHCGDGYTDASEEACDDGDASNNNACLTNCQLNVCGDGYIFNTGPGADETCDDGSKNGYYENQCIPGPCCNTSCDGDGPHCGDSIIQNEVCGGIPSCVDGITGANEICDVGTDNGKWLTLAEHNLDAGCSSLCDDIAPYCGDNILQSTYEVCDDGGANQNGVYGKCQTDCQAKPRCGDGRIDGPGGDGLTTGPEVCDDGLSNGAYGFCNNSCTGYVECGDAVLQSTHEECDLGTGNFTDYSVSKIYSCCYTNVGDCPGDCIYGRYCGDANVDDGRDPSVSTDLYYRFDETSGSSVLDHSGNGRNGVAANVIRAYGKNGRGMFVDHSSQPSLERVTGPGVLATTDLTLEAWVFPTSYAADYATVILGNPAYYLSVYNNGSLRAYWYDKSPAGYHSTAAGLVPLMSWTHVAAVWTATELKLYTNGTLRRTIAVTGTGRAATSTIIGAQSTARQFRGLIDEVAISARALSEAEIMTHVTGKSGEEYCDDGDGDHGNGNVAVGTAVLDYETTCSDACTFFHFCGDGKVDGPGGDGVTSGPEVCDDGLPGNFGEYNRCNPGCLEFGPHCGDGEKNGPEECDKAPGNSDSAGTVWDGSNDASATCRTDCSWATCGDGIIDTGEECDDGILNSDTNPGACRTNCIASKCGDGVADPGEQCDDMNTVDYDSCTNLCLNSRCGDNIRKTIDSTTGEYSWSPNETCDDGNTNNNDYCRSDCMQVTGYCGDGTIQTGHPASEACDNASTGDGIGAYCTGPCTGSGASKTCSVGCTLNHGACGDGDIDYIASEICDDGNAINGDYCSYPNCQITGYCGDGTVQINEACDSADSTVGAGQGIGGYCTNSCQTNLGSCGDGKIQGLGYTTAMYGGTLPTGTGWSLDGPEYCDTSDPRVLSLGTAFNIGCDGCQREGSCGDGIRQLRFESCDTGTLPSPIFNLEMDETSGTVASDSSSNGYDATVYNGAVWTPGVNGNALKFDGSNDYAIINDNIVGTPSVLTVAAWVRNDGNGSTYECAVHKGNGASIGASEYWLGFETGTDNLVATIGAGTGVGWAAGRTSIPAVVGVWYHLAASWDGSNVKVYVNGNLEKEYALSSYNNLTTPTRIGASSDGANYQYNGAVDDVRIYDKAFSAVDILSLMSNESPLLHLKMDEASGTIASDSSGKGYNATVSGAVWVPGQFDNALKFDGTNDYAIVNDVVVVNPSALTIAAWVRKDGNGANYECAIHKGADTSIGGSEYFIGFQDGTDNIIATIGARTAAISWTAGLTSVKANWGVWYHVAITWDGSNAKVYVNGSVVKTYALSTYSNLTTPTRIGSSGNGTGYLFNGAVDDVRIYDRAFSDAGITSLMSNGTDSCYPGCMSDPKGALNGAGRTSINGWACDPDHSMTQNEVKLIFTDVDGDLISTQTFNTSVASESQIIDICGGGANHRWDFDPNAGTINWVGFQQPFTVRAYALTPDGVPETDVFIGARTFTMADICGDGVHEGDEECDDGNSVNTDNCRNDCDLPSCGDGVVSSTATGIYNETCELGQTTSCNAVGATGGSGAPACQTDCKGWVTAPNVCTKTWGCAARPQVHSSTETGWNSVASYNQVWDGTKWVPSDSPTVFSNFSSTTECRFRCGTNFGYDSATPDWKNPAAWSTSSKVSWDSGQNALKFTGYAWNYLNTYIPIDTSKEYYLEYDIMVLNGDGSRTYGGTRSFNSSYTSLPGHPGSYDYFTDSASTAGGTFTPGVWYTRKNSVISGAPRTGESSTTSDRAKWHTGTKYAKVLIIHGYSTGTTQVTYIRNLKFYPVGASGNCVGTSRRFTCNAKPATGTAWTSPSYYDQTWTWNGSAYNWLPTADSDTNYNTTYAANQCQFECLSTYHWNGSSCVSNSATWTCPGKPANSVWNSVSSYGQSWNGSAFIPASDSTTEYNVIPSTSSCRYKCAPGYFHSGGVCYPTSCGDSITTDTGVAFTDEKVYLTMDEGVGSIAYDSSGNSNNGTISGATWTSGQFGSGLNFDGSNDEINISYTLPTNNFTMMAWVNPDTTHQIDSQSNSSTTGTGGQKYLFYPDNQSTNGGAGVSVGTNGVSVYEHGSGYMPPLAVYDNPVVGWNHVAVTYTNKQPRIYVNGVLKATGFTSPKGTVYAPDNVGGGGYGHFDGQVDHVRIIAKSLSQAEVVQAMGEFCDQGASNSDSWHASPVCNTSCTGWSPYCGDDTTTSPETCDWGDGAVSTTSWTLNASCDTACTSNRYCGDGTDDAEEACDKSRSYTPDALCDKRYGSRNYYDWSTSSCGSTCAIGGTCYYCGDGAGTSTSNLKMHLGFEYELKDNSLSGNHASGTAYYIAGATGTVNTGRALNVTSSNVTVPHSSSLNLPRNMSIEFWINTSQWVSSTVTPIPILVKGTATTLNYAFWLEPLRGTLPNGHISFVTYPTTAGCGVHTRARISGGGWKHIVGTYDGSTMRIYVDGVEEPGSAESCYKASTTYSSNPLYIGRWSGYSNFSGYLDDIKLYNKTLSATEIRRNFKERCDDGNNTNGDGCSSTCTVERYNRCSGTSTSSCSVPTCSHRIVLYDSYGDGWHGNNSVRVYVNNVLQGTYALTTGGYGPQTYYFNAYQGAPIRVEYTAGSYPGECYYYLYNGSGGTMASSYYPNTSGTYNGTGSCP